MTQKKIQIGKILLEKNLITQDQLNQAIARHDTTGERLGESLIHLKFIDEDTWYQMLSEQLNLPFVNVKNYKLKPEIVRSLPEMYARRYRCIVLEKNSSGYLVGMVDPQDLLATDKITQVLKSSIQLALVKEADLLSVIDLMYRRSTEITNLAGELSAELAPDDTDLTKLTEGLSLSDAPVVKLLQSIFDDAVQVNASDIHIEPDENLLRIRQRIDGVLYEQILKEKDVAPALTLRLKLMAGLNIAEKRLPQDGRFSIKLKGKNFDVRLSTMPVAFGESVVMRLLNQSSELIHLDKLGMPDTILTRLRSACSLPNGLILVTGPTGSGKTTTLYGIINELNKSDTKIITAEDPIEYRMARVSQVQVQPEIDLSFARILRSILRQDPDIIMVGELRDQETAIIAVRAAMTGHIVLSTLHTNDAISTPVRLIDMGVEGFLVATILRAVVAQRLVRRICQNCMTPQEPTAQEKVWIAAFKDFHYTGMPFKVGVGCTYCHHTGYHGQVGLYELLELNEALANALRANHTSEFIRLAKQDPNFRPLVLYGLDLAAEGLTTISEIIRIFGDLGIEDSTLLPANPASLNEI